MIYTEATKHRGEEVRPGNSALLGGRKLAAQDGPKSPYERLPGAIHNYGTCLSLGHKYLFQCLPRMLTLWFDFTESALEEQAQTGS